MEIKSFVFALPVNQYDKQDVHGRIFDLFKKLKIKDFTPHVENPKPIIFFSTGQHIICRTNSLVSGIPMKEHVINVEKLDKITGKITLPLDLPKLVMNKESEKEFIEKNGYKPKYSETHKFHRMDDVEIKEYAIKKLLETAGLKVLGDVGVDEVGHRKVTGRNKSIKAVDISFKAEILDLDLFNHAWFRGVGRNKSYGFGMIRAEKS